MSFTCTGSFDTQTSPTASYARVFEDLMWSRFSFNQTTHSVNSVLCELCAHFILQLQVCLHKSAASQDPKWLCIPLQWPPESFHRAKHFLDTLVSPGSEGPILSKAGLSQRIPRKSDPRKSEPERPTPNSSKASCLQSHPKNARINKKGSKRFNKQSLEEIQKLTAEEMRRVMAIVMPTTSLGSLL